MNLHLNTERLLLRPVAITDAPAIFRYRSDVAANRFQGWVPSSREDVNDFIQNRTCKTINTSGTWFQFVILIKENGELIGDIGLHFFDAENEQTETGITLDRNYQGNNYAREAMTEIFRFLFEELEKHRITASLDPRNSSAIRLVESLGMRREAHFKESIFFKGEWVDDLVYGFLKKEFMADGL